MRVSRTVVTLLALTVALFAWGILQASEDRTETGTFSRPWGGLGPPVSLPAGTFGESSDRADMSASWASLDTIEQDRRAGDSSPQILAQRSASTGPGSRPKELRPETVWKSDDIDMLGVGIGVGDLDGDGKNDIVVADPSKVYLYRFSEGKLHLINDYSAGALEIKAIDVAKIRKQGPPRIYVSAQNRGSVSSFVLDYRDGKLTPAIQEIPYFLRVIVYPTQGPILLGQRKGLRRMYEGPVYRLTDKGDALETAGRFGVPLKIPVFGFAIGDLMGNRKPLIAVYDRNEHLRIYEPSGKRLYISKEYYGESDIVLRWAGPERRTALVDSSDDAELTFFRPRIMSLDLDGNGTYEILVLAHFSKTRRLLSRTKMLEEGQVEGLVWNGDTLEQRWSTPKIQGMIADFTVDSLPGLEGLRVITLVRKKTDWLTFLRSKSQIRAYDVRSLMEEGIRGGSRREGE